MREPKLFRDLGRQKTGSRLTGVLVTSIVVVLIVSAGIPVNADLVT